ncbi:MAG: Asp-tRNA(Asn)/Glu-tRNA(Gln) amidotransferase subunit GatC [Spirochaetales bacterium]|nr:Asp-tRNA(Asn)/Glu-tRNA(Gln) amidotransferase subunit GatC [Spirochaetales bacterium]
MKLDELYVTAKLAKLDLGEKEAEVLAVEVSRMLEYFSVMEKVDVAGLEATVQTLGRENRTRSDTVSSVDVTGKMLTNAPETEDRFIVIPKVL